MFYLLEIRSFQSTSLNCTGFVIIGRRIVTTPHPQVVEHSDVVQFPSLQPTGQQASKQGTVRVRFPHGLPLAEAIVANNFSAKIEIIVEFA